MRKIAPSKFVFIFPDSQKRIVSINYIDEKTTLEKISETDSFVFIIDADKYNLCGMTEFTVYNFKKRKIEYKSKKLRHCCN
jgi:hypothetical protein